MVLPSRRRWRRKPRSQRMPSGSRPLAGSSRMSTCGSPSRAAARPSRWRMPMRVAAGPLAGRGRDADQLEHLVDPLARRRRRCRRAPAGGCGRCGRGGSSSPRAPSPTTAIGLGDVVRSAGRRWSPCRCVGRTRPSSMRRVVVLPAPLGPRKPVIRPGSTSKLRSSTAVKVPKRLVRPRTSMRVAAASAVVACSSGSPVGSSCGPILATHAA